MNNFYKYLFLIISLLFPGYVTAAKASLSVGIVPQFDAQHISQIWQPILDALEKETGLHFYLSGSSTIPGFEDEFMGGKFDLAYMNPYHAYQSGKAKKYIPLIRDTGTSMHGIIVVRADSDIRNVKDLRNRLIAFPSPNALGASILLRAALREEFGIEFQQKYVQSHSSVYLNVALGRVDAGGGVQKSLSRQRQSIQNRLRIIYETEKFPAHPLVAKSTLPKPVREKITLALLKIAASNEGKTLFAAIPMKQPGRAHLKDYDGLAKLPVEKYYQRN